MKLLKSMVVMATLLGFLGCASSPSKVDRSAPDYSQQKAPLKRTPRYASIDDAVSYLARSLAENLDPSSGGRRFSAATGGDPSSARGEQQKTSAEETTRRHAREALEELDREIAGQEGEKSGGVSISSNEEYSTQRGGGTAPGTFIAEHQLEIACLFSPARDPSTLN